MRKGQTIMLMLGLVFLAVVVIILTWQALAPSAVPEAVKAEHQQIEAFLVDLIRRGTTGVIREMENHGGYLATEVPVNKAPFMGRAVPYWHMCEDVSVIPDIPTIEGNVATGLSRYLRTYLNATEMISGKVVRYDLTALSVTARMLENQIAVTVTLPLTIGGYPVLKPYAVGVPTLFGRIYNFAKDFSEDEADRRFMEAFTGASIFYAYELPHWGMLGPSCNDMVYLTAAQVSAVLEREVKETLRGIVLWQSVSPAPGNYPLFRVKGKEYKDLKISFWLPDNFNIPGWAILITNTRSIYTGSMGVEIGSCVTSYQREFPVAYTYIVNVRDTLLNNDFHFAGLVYNQDTNTAGSCAAIVLPVGECDNLPCEAKITVTDTAGNPIGGAFVMFDGCALGETEPDGVVVGPIKCDTGELTIAREGYNMLTETVDASDLGDAYYMMPYIPHINLFMERFYQDCGTIAGPINESISLTIEGFMAITNVNTSSTLVCDVPECDECANTHDYDTCMACMVSKSHCDKDTIITNVSINHIPSGEYPVNLSVHNPAIISQYGAEYPVVIIPMRVTSTITIPSHDSSLIVKIPKTDDIYMEAIEVYNTTYNDWYAKCIGGTWKLEVFNMSNCTDVNGETVCEGWNESMWLCNQTDCLCNIQKSVGCWNNTEFAIGANTDYKPTCNFTDCWCAGGYVCDEVCADEKGYNAGKQYIFDKAGEYNNKLKECGLVI